METLLQDVKHTLRIFRQSSAFTIAAVASATPLSQNAYKVTLARVAVKRALLEAAKQKA